MTRSPSSAISPCVLGFWLIAVRKDLAVSNPVVRSGRSGNFSMRQEKCPVSRSAAPGMCSGWKGRIFTLRLSNRLNRGWWMEIDSGLTKYEHNAHYHIQSVEKDVGDHSDVD